MTDSDVGRLPLSLLSYSISGFSGRVFEYRVDRRSACVSCISYLISDTPYFIDVACVVFKACITCPDSEYQILALSYVG